MSSNQRASTPSRSVSSARDARHLGAEADVVRLVVVGERDARGGDLLLELLEPPLERRELLLRGAQLGAGERRARLPRLRHAARRVPRGALALARAQPQVLVDAARAGAAGGPTRIAYCWSVTRSRKYRSCETTMSVPGQRVEQVLHRGEHVGVEVVRRLVEDQHVRLLEQDQQQLQPALLPAGEVLHRRRELRAREAHALEQLPGRELLRLRARRRTS